MVPAARRASASGALTTLPGRTCNLVITAASRQRGVVVALRIHTARMSYNLLLDCGCTVYVACHPRTNEAHTRIIEFRGSRCAVRKHEVGLKLYVWELLPERAPAKPVSVDWDMPAM